MSVETPSLFAQAIQQHLELKRRNSALEPRMPLDGYLAEDPFENHPLFKSEEQARIEDTMSGEETPAVVSAPIVWPSGDTVVGAAVVAGDAQGEPDAESSEDGLWSRSRDFDWGD